MGILGVLQARPHAIFQYSRDGIHVQRRPPLKIEGVRGTHSGLHFEKFENRGLKRLLGTRAGASTANSAESEPVPNAEIWSVQPYANAMRLYGHNYF